MAGLDYSHTDDVKVLNLPLTKEDYIRMYPEGTSAIKDISRKLQEYESRLVPNDNASESIASCYYATAFLSLLASKNFYHAFSSFERAVEKLGGKNIAFAFILEKKEYFEGAILPVGEKGIMSIYLHRAEIKPKVFVSKNISEEEARNTASSFIKTWEEEMLHRINTKLV